MLSERGLIIVITGVTASGKDAVKSELLKRLDNISLIVTATTRPMRVGEQNGREHFFISKEDFLRERGEGKFLETNEYAGNFYGTYKNSFEKVLQGEKIIWRIDPSAASKVEQLLRDGFEEEVADKLVAKLVVIFIDAPDIETLIKRMRRRGMNGGAIKERLDKDRENLKLYKGYFRNIVVNREGELDKTMAEILHIIEGG